MYKLYILDYENRCHIDYIDNLIKLYHIFYKKHIKKILPSPRRHIMTKYGGYISDENYLNTIKKISNCIDFEDNIKKEYITSNKITNSDSDED